MLGTPQGPQSRARTAPVLAERRCGQTPKEQVAGDVVRASCKNTPGGKHGRRLEGSMQNPRAHGDENKTQKAEGNPSQLLPSLTLRNRLSKGQECRVRISNRRGDGKL